MATLVGGEYTVGSLVERSLSGGVVAIWEAKRACSLAHADPSALSSREREILEREEKKLGELAASERASERCASRHVEAMYVSGKLPLWRVVSGIFPEMDLDGMHPNERSWRLTKLIRAMEKVCRYEWRVFRKRIEGGERAGEFEATSVSDPTPGPSPLTGRGDGVLGESGDGERSGEIEGDGDPHGRDAHATVSDPRVSWWDPLRFVCGQFGMAYSTLSRFAREVAGLSASDLADRVKAEKMRTAMRAEVKAWLLEAYAAHPEWKELPREEAFAAVLNFVQEQRGRGVWSRASWAVRFGYSSYTKFNRASLASYGVSPVELERMIVGEILEEGERQEGGRQKAEGGGQDGDGDGGRQEEGFGGTGRMEGTLRHEDSKTRSRADFSA